MSAINAIRNWPRSTRMASSTFAVGYSYRFPPIGLGAAGFRNSQLNRPIGNSLLRPNDCLRLPARLQGRPVSKSRDAGPINFIGWFGQPRSVSVERVPTSLPEWAEQFCVEGFVTSKLETDSPLVLELGPRRIVKRATLPDTARVPDSYAFLRSTGQWKERLAGVIVPPPPSPGALLQFNELLLARHVDVVDALASHGHDT